MVLNLSGEVNYEMFNSLIKSFNLLKEDRLLVYLSSEGGLAEVAEAMLDFINRFRDKIELIFYGEVFSAAMILFLKAACPKTILPDTVGMYHFSWQELTISEGGKPNSAYDIFSLKGMKESKARTLAYLKDTKLTDKEVASIKKGHDVYFTHSRMREIMN